MTHATAGAAWVTPGAAEAEEGLVLRDASASERDGHVPLQRHRGQYRAAEAGRRPLSQAARRASAHPAPLFPRARWAGDRHPGRRLLLCLPGRSPPGEQVLLSETTSALVGTDLPDGVDIREVGRRKLKGIDRPEPIYTLLIPDLPLPDAPPAGSTAESKPSSEAAERARQTLERRVLADLERAVADAEAGKHRGWSDTVRWVLVTIIIVLGVVVVAVVALGILYQMTRPGG